MSTHLSRMHGDVDAVDVDGVRVGLEQVANHVGHVGFVCIIEAEETEVWLGTEDEMFAVAMFLPNILSMWNTWSTSIAPIANLDASYTSMPLAPSAAASPLTLVPLRIYRGEKRHSELPNSMSRKAIVRDTMRIAC